MTGRVRLGAVGAGWWATSNHFPIFAARDDVDLVGDCGIGPELDAVREQFGFGMATTDYDELLDQDLDAVVISTPHDLHHPQAVAAIDRGMHVLVFESHRERMWFVSPAKSPRVGEAMWQSTCWISPR